MSSWAPATAGAKDLVAMSEAGMGRTAAEKDAGRGRPDGAAAVARGEREGATADRETELDGGVGRASQARQEHQGSFIVTYDGGAVASESCALEPTIKTAPRRTRTQGKLERTHG